MRIALVTGGASGLGLATAQLLATRGMTVVAIDHDVQALEQAVRMLPGADHRGFALDVSDAKRVQEAFEATERELGPVEVLATFAGISGQTATQQRPSITETTVEDWDRVFAINVRGTFLFIREMARHRKQRPVAHGRIITVSSTGGQLGGYSQTSSYCASKGAVLSMTKIAARELASLGITVNCIAPGPIDTPMLRSAFGPRVDLSQIASALLPLARFGRPEEVAEAVAYLASEGAAFVTGATLDVNGGMRMQ